LVNIFTIFKTSIEAIQDYIHSVSFDEYSKERQRKKAVEREFEIIGEALNKLLKHYPEIPISDIPKIIGLRNYIIHGYDSISDDIIWATIKKSLPLLKQEIEAIIQNQNPL
jgi:uncharacterized protein with HEPN domain